MSGRLFVLARSQALCFEFEGAASFTPFVKGADFFF